ncbi:4-hydroxybenzoate 3-monooxygenase [Aurantimonas marianensis]|uniref:4-hydroxybenzoate 3-monooxygenase n=1 Tax=Aurantimonas marianensis TaxID=2920428 RepID=A0A9X2HBS4_9HYPH|nr:4-hydroxybenzoate 3-monooxygenase [Aurantimonas marianensis]MCP3054029.1 4-hydroxybenzoate 3-monooxygenase [Aurantimonas marianensis]
MRHLERTRVAIIGGGPAGLLLALILHRAGIDSVVLERGSRDDVLSRMGADMLEKATTDILRTAGVGGRLDREGLVHDGFDIAWRGEVLHIPLRDLTGKTVTIYGETELTHDLYDALDEAGVPIIHGAEDVRPQDIATDAPFVTFHTVDGEHSLECDYVAGCDGFHGVCRQTIPADLLRTFERVYPFGWLGILTRTPPIQDELIYAHHARGFALCSLRSPQLSRYCLQCDAGDDVANWPDERFFDELEARLPVAVAAHLKRGPSIEKSIAPLRSFVAEPMGHGRLFLAGDAAHIVPPAGAKGLNLAVSDVHYLSRALIAHYRDKDDQLLKTYSETALARVWKAERFSWWFTSMIHMFGEEGTFSQRIQEAEFDYLAGSQAAQTALAENYVGLPY